MGTPRSHLAARFSIVVGYLCFLANCLANQMISRFGFEGGQWLGTIVGWSTSLLVVGGLVLGVIGWVGGRRRNATDTMGVAVIGILLNSAILGLMFYGLWMIAVSATP